MGSEKYPYKGIIDHFANRGFSNGTNAWTDTDHTAYTVSTAGEAGFLQILPIYVDHILYPTITKAGFTTEVCQNFPACYSDRLVVIRCITLIRKARTREWSILKCKAAKTRLGISWHCSTSSPTPVAGLKRVVRFQYPNTSWPQGTTSAQPARERIPK